MNLPALIAQKEELVNRLRQAKYADVAEAHGFPIRYGPARSADERTLHVDGEPVPAAVHGDRWGCMRPVSKGHRWPGDYLGGE